MSKAISFGVCNKNKNVYMILTWVEGEPLIKSMKRLSEYEQYNLKAGKILKEIHSIPVEKVHISNENNLNKKIEKILKYENSYVRIDNDEDTIAYVKENINKLHSKEHVYKHGDFHVGNMILTKDNDLGIIDFNRLGCGDKYEEFYRIQSFDVELSIPFSIGQIDGYFDYNPTKEFWEILSVYVAHSSLVSINWAEYFSDEDVNGMKKRAIKALYDYNNFEEIVPSWYKNNLKKYRK